MRSLTIITAIILMIINAACAWAMPGVAFVVCENGAHVVTISGWHNEEYHGEVVGLELQREAVGGCAAVDFVPGGPFPFDPIPDPSIGLRMYETTVTTVPPLAGVTYRYTPFGVRPDGTLVPIIDYCDGDYRSYALATCGTTPFARGEVEVLGSGSGELSFGIELCAPDCWTEFVGMYLDIATLEELAGEPWTDLVGQIVDVFGERAYCAMPGGDYHSITRIERAPAGVCGAVPAETTNWGSLKAIYR